MARLNWSSPGERLFETGIDRGVFYPKSLSPGVPWNGLVRVSESNEGGEISSIYYEGEKISLIASREFFGADLTAFSAPLEFREYDGQLALAPGLFANNQDKKPFDMSYRSIVGDDLVGSERGYKIHLLYNVVASQKRQSYETAGSRVDADEISWKLDAVPPPVSEVSEHQSYQPTAHFIVDSINTLPERLSLLEDILYGSSTTDARMPSVDELITTLMPPSSP